MGRKFLILVFVLGLFGAAMAQNPWYGSGYSYSDPVGYYMNQQWVSNQAFQTVMSGQMFLDSAKRKAGTGQGQGRKPSRSGSEPTRVLKATQFAPGPNYVLPDMIAKLDTGDARQKAAIKKAAAELLDLYHQTAKKDGFPSNDLAYAFEYFVVNNYMYYHDLFDVYSDPKISAIQDPLLRLQKYNEKKMRMVSLSIEQKVYSQFIDVLSKNAAIAKMTGKQKQETAELLALMTGMAYASYAPGLQKGDQEAMERGRQKAKVNLERLLRVSVDRLTISDDGLSF